ncbi:unconventional prefoldin RPB5 interactor-like protein [Homalodisca vitripennis]|uniref:unconventional prefoldin RPB5 interactor-like protein n=1 Tax=Homalodisca vitripennis TaxID=197043 RepID=UPI001EEC5096|nr:unconventional prefoldin RPB5 interactor-like protein [Homalodisca vitripennis]
MASSNSENNIYIKEAAYNIQYLLQQTHDQALERNELQTKRWQDYQDDHKEVSDRLLSLRDELTHTIMVPIGKKALMRGNLVHTNEILVCLGDGWFAKRSAKQAADICQRRVQHSEEMLRKLEKEKELLTTRKSFPSDNEVFGSADCQEIIEPYDEEEEKQWRERHRQKEKEHRQKLAELRKGRKTEVETEDDLWKLLDALDQEEELEDELHRMGKDVEEESDEECSDDESESGSSSEKWC